MHCHIYDSRPVSIHILMQKETEGKYNLTILKCAYVVISIDVQYLHPAMSWYDNSTFDRIEHLIHRSIEVTIGNVPL